jgi:MFS family permease
MSSLGALASAEINFSILNNVSGDSKLFLQYGVISTIVLLLGLGYTLFCLKAGNSYYVRGSNPRRSPRELLGVARESMKCPEITNGYTAAFLARGDSILLSLYLVLWTYSFSDPADRSDEVYEEAFSRASMLSGISYAVIMLTCIIYGRYYERRNFSRSKVMIVMFSVAAAGAFTINLASSPSSYMAYVSLVVLGVGMSGLLTASLYLVNEYSTPESRGFITGVQTFFGVLGILFQTIVGAVLYEWVSRSGPFNYFGATCLVVLLITLYAYKHRKQELGSPAVDQLSLIEDPVEPAE